MKHLMRRAARGLAMLAGLALATCASDGTVFGPDDKNATDGVRGDRPTEKRSPRMELGPEISHSRGVDGGLVLLWPRIVPKSEIVAMRGPAKALQDRLKAMLEQHFPGRPIDVRPEPERVCPKPGGCDATSVGVLIGVQHGECVAVVLVSPPGESAQLLMPWAGGMEAPVSVPFREPPESSIALRDMVPCDKLPIATLDREERVRDALEIAQ